MAKTYPKYPLSVGAPSDAFEGYITRPAAEGASQTFPAGSPVKGASGYVAVFVNPTDAKLLGFAKKAGSNVAAGAATNEIILAVDGLVWYANFLGAAGIDNVLAQTDFYVAYDIASGAILADGGSAWYLLDATADPVLVIVGYQADYTFPDKEDSFAAAGDTNVRVPCHQLAGTGRFV